jgi:hypothetical protein
MFQGGLECLHVLSANRRVAHPKNLRGGLPFTQFVKGGLLFARGVVADLQVGAFAFAGVGLPV